MKLAVIAATLSLLAFALPVEGADPPPGFGRCELKYEAIAEDVEIPTGVQCYWSGPGPYPCWITYTTLAGDGPVPTVQVPTGIECGY